MIKKIKYIFLYILFSIIWAVNSFSATIDYDKKINAILISGEIQEGDYKKVEKIVKDNDVKFAFLASQGGRADEGFNIGMLFHFKKIKTIVPSKKICLSACAFIWIGGSERFLTPKSIIGFHRPYNIKTGKNSESGFGILAWHVGFYKFSWQMVEDIKNTNKDKIIYFDKKIAERWILPAYIIEEKK